MSPPTTGLAVLAVLFFVYKYLTRTDVPKIKGLYVRSLWS